MDDWDCFARLAQGYRLDEDEEKAEICGINAEVSSCKVNEETNAYVSCTGCLFRWRRQHRQDMADASRSVNQRFTFKVDSSQTIPSSFPALNIRSRRRSLH